MRKRWGGRRRRSGKGEDVAIRLGRFSRNVATTFFTQVLALLFAVANTALVVRVLGPGGKGMLDLALLVPPILGLLLGGGIGLANMYFIGSGRMKLPELVSNSVTYALLATLLGVVIVAILFLTGTMARIVPGVPRWMILLALAGLPVSIAYGYFSSILHGMNRIATLNVATTCMSGTTMIFTIVLVVILHLNLAGAILGSLSGSLTALILVLVLLRREGAVYRPRWQQPVMRDTISFGLRGHVGNILQFMNYRLDVFLVNYYAGAAQVGIYGISARLAELLWYLPQAVSFAILPKAAASDQRTMHAFTPKAFGYTLCLTALGGLCLLLVGRSLITLVFSRTFSGAYLPMVALLPGVVLLGGGKVLTNEMAGRGYPHYNSINSGFALILTIVFDLILIPRHGIMGAAVASSIAYSTSFFTALFFYLYLRRRSRQAA
jgi:O-antigen/teichoic acid export membrane protein